MNVIRCNKCGKYFKDRIYQGEVRIPDLTVWLNDYRRDSCTSAHIKDVALCETCTILFLHFLTNGGNEEKIKTGGEE